MIFDHIVITVKHLERSTQFYIKALAPLGITLIKKDEGGAGFGTNNKPSFWICDDGIIQQPMHIAFVAQDHAAIDKFHAEAILVGGINNGEPGERVQYHSGYYAAFVLDPDGHNIEAVYRKRFR